MELVSSGLSHFSMPELEMAVARLGSCLSEVEVGRGREEAVEAEGEEDEAEEEDWLCCECW